MGSKENRLSKMKFEAVCAITLFIGLIYAQGDNSTITDSGEDNSTTADNSTAGCPYECIPRLRFRRGHHRGREERRCLDLLEDLPCAEGEAPEVGANTTGIRYTENKILIS